MTINLSQDLEKIVHDAVRAGRYATENDVIRDALIRLEQTMPQDKAMPAAKPRRAKVTPQDKKSLTRDEFDRHLLAMGLLSQLPDTAADFDDPDDEPIEIKGEALSATVIRERR